MTENFLEMISSASLCRLPLSRSPAILFISIALIAWFYRRSSIFFNSYRTTGEALESCATLNHLECKWTLVVQSKPGLNGSLVFSYWNYRRHRDKYHLAPFSMSKRLKSQPRWPQTFKLRKQMLSTILIDRNMPIGLFSETETFQFKWHVSHCIWNPRLQKALCNRV